MEPTTTTLKRQKPGPKPKLTPAQMQIVWNAHQAGEMTADQLAARFGVSRPTIYNTLRRMAPQQAA